MTESPLVRMEVSKDVRVQRLVSEYGPANREEFLEIMGKVTKKLGGQHYNAAKEKLLQGDIASTIDILLTYYDKAYLNSIEKRKNSLLANVSWDGIDSNSFAQTILNLPYRQ
jgi:tRNA 2-selenouridine synthase